MPEAVHDTTNRPSVVSISWGGPEDSWTQQAREQLEQVFSEAAELGVTVTVAAGDNGSTDGLQDGHQHVDFPASAPHALACGGTSLQAQGAAIASETVWNDGPGRGATGGGVSVEFAFPGYQANANVPANVDTQAVGRGVPDVAGNADPETGYQILADGNPQTVGGTSAVAPLWAGLVALLNQSLGAPVGFLQPQLYELPSGTFKRHRRSGQRRLPGGTGLGRLHGSRLAERRRAPAGAEGGGARSGLAGSHRELKS